MPPTFIVRQLSNPHGMLGTLLRHFMNRQNAEINSLALQSLEIRSSDRVLEVGFGGGLNLPSILNCASFAAGLDRSPNVLNFAIARYRRAIEEDRAEFRLGFVELIPYESGYFDKICSVHGIQFWKSLTKPGSELFRVLAPNGRLVVGFHTRDFLEKRYRPTGLIYPRTGEEIARALKMSGFRSIRSIVTDRAKSWQVLVAEK